MDNKNSHLEVMKRSSWSSALEGRFQIKNTAQILYFVLWACSSFLVFFISLIFLYDMKFRHRHGNGWKLGLYRFLTTELPNINSSLITYLAGQF